MPPRGSGPRLTWIVRTFTDPPPSSADQVFGCQLESLCQREGDTVPSFVRLCVEAVDKKGCVSQTPKISPFKPRTQSPHLCLPRDSFLPRIPHLNTFRVPIFPIPHLLGLDVDGIYRVSGNLAVVQKLRFLVDRGKRSWEGVMNQRIGYLRTKSGSEGGSRNCMSQLLVSSRACYRTGSHL